MEQQLDMDERTPEKRYDAALSFLVRDLALAQALYDGLSPSLRVFFFPRSQEELAGTDGQESMREPFFHQSRLNIVLYSEGWGRTPWTRVEAAAIQDACLEQGWETLFFFMADPAAARPVWLPGTHIRFNHGDFPLEQAIGAIKARVRERGGEFQPMTPLRQAELYKAEELYRADRAMFLSMQGIEQIQAEVKMLFAAVEAQCEAIREQGYLPIRCEWSFNERSDMQACVFTTERQGGMVLSWQQPYSNTLDESVLRVEEYATKLILGSEMGKLQYMTTPKPIASRRYSPELSKARQHGWKEKGKDAGEFVASADLAQRCIMQFLQSAEKRAKRSADQW